MTYNLIKIKYGLSDHTVRYWTMLPDIHRDIELLCYTRKMASKISQQQQNTRRCLCVIFQFKYSKTAFLSVEIISHSKLRTIEIFINMHIP